MSEMPEIETFLYANADPTLNTWRGLVVQKAEADGIFWRCRACGEFIREARGVELGPPVTFVIDAVCPNGHGQEDWPS